MRRLCRKLLVLTFAVIPVLCLTVTASNALFCALAVFFSLLLACGVRLLGDKIVPASVKNIVIIIVIALGISLVQLFAEGRLSADAGAEAFMPLCAVPALLLLGLSSGRKGAKSTLLFALVEGGLFAALMVVIGALREIIGLGTFFGVSVTRKIFDPIAVLALPAGAIFVIALFIAVLQYIAKEDSANA